MQNQRLRLTFQYAPIAVISAMAIISMMIVANNQKLLTKRIVVQIRNHTTIADEIADSIRKPYRPAQPTLISGAVEKEQDEHIFEIEDNLCTIEKHYGLVRFGGGPSYVTPESSSYLDLFKKILRDISILLEQSITNQKNIMVMGAITFFLIQTHIFKQRRCAKSVAASLSGALFLAGLFFGITT